jgi:uncharacterized phage protein gp47/JayE
MQVVDTSSVGLHSKEADAGLIGALAFTYTQATKVLAFTDASTIPAGHTFQALNIEVYDKNGDMKAAQIAAAAGTANVDLDAATSLDLTGEFDIVAVLVTDKGNKVGSYKGLKIGADVASTSLVFEK